jgi:hypothetical protein
MSDVIRLGEVGEEIPIISLWQPWASLVAWGEKKIETRSWAYGGPLPTVLAIHAAKHWDDEIADMCCDKHFRDALARNAIELPGDARDRLPFGAVVGVVRLVECVGTWAIDAATPIDSLARRYLTRYASERYFGDYSPNRFAWSFDQRIELATPIPLVGRQRIWRWRPPADVLDWCRHAMTAKLVKTDRSPTEKT